MGFFKKFLFGSVDPEEAEAEARAEAGTHTILVIDDDKAYLETIRGALAEVGFNVLKSNTGSKGLNMIRYAGNVEVVLLDYEMPDFDGVQTLKFIRQISPKSKVIAVTGLDLKFVPSAFRTGVDHLLAKPFESAELIQTIRNFLQPAPVAVGEK